MDALNCKQQHFQWDEVTHSCLGCVWDDRLSEDCKGCEDYIKNIDTPVSERNKL